MYSTFKCLHLLGMVLLLGNVTATSVWKVFADRTRDPVTTAFAQRLVTLTDWSLTLGGIVLILGGGYGMVAIAGYPWRQPGWLLNGQLLFLASGVVWLLVLLPIQRRQAVMARAFASGSGVPPHYWRLGRHWLGWGVVATVPLVAALVIMVCR